MYDAPSTKKIFDILRFVVSQQFDVGVSEIARAVGLSKGTTFGILTGLGNEGYISKNGATRKYTVGPELFQLSKLLERRSDLATIAKPWLDRLAMKLKTTVLLGIKDRNRIRIEEVSEAGTEMTISSSIGTTLPLAPGAPGKVLLSSMSGEEIGASIANQPCSNSRARQSGNKVDLWAEIEEVRRVGYATDLTGEYAPGIWAVAMGLDCDTESRCAVAWVAGFRTYLDEKGIDRIVNGLRQTIGQIEKASRARLEEGCHDIRKSQSLTRCDNSANQTVTAAR